MGIVSDILDAAVEISTGSAELVGDKVNALVVGVVAALAMIGVLILFYMSPLYGLAALLAVIVIVAVLSQNEGDSIV